METHFNLSLIRASPELHLVDLDTQDSAVLLNPPNKKERKKDFFGSAAMACSFWPTGMDWSWRQSGVKVYSLKSNTWEWLGSLDLVDVAGDNNGKKAGENGVRDRRRSSN
ncbi:hypothetical protein PanWU01x14_051130 [Parasponia andersonii]|uniref:Uncharacterized protein n=1 Tax=Parasponia andersonii TaxID=3476 RepID=A0A2P5DLW6_PARAD|nr:hypothetical protein PanWU01x14_051130 [Parasponia andersonii]